MNSRFNTSNFFAVLIFVIVLMQFCCPVLSAACTGTYQYSKNNNSYPIPYDGNWTYSPITISGAPAGATVTCVEVHYEITGPWSGLTRVDLTNQNLDREVTLEDYEEGNLIRTWTVSSTFDGEPVNQTWLLWATESYAYESGTIDSWWIRVYYEGGGGYCDASTSNTGFEHISRVQVGDIDNTSGSSGYADYTAYSTQMQIGQSYGITVNNGQPYATDVCGIWVDWNQDEDFTDTGEEITVSGGPATFTATITPPAGAVAGETRMRVRIVDSDWDALGPCGAASYGEVEDYTIEVISYRPGKITGSKFNDLDGDGNWDGAEDGIEGWEIYLDLNDNGQYETSEPNVTTGVDGFYEFTDLAPDTYIVAEMERPGWQQTHPAGGSTHTIAVDPNGVVKNINFGNTTVPIDYCSASGGCVLMGGNEYISGVHVGMINSWTFCGGYNHYSSITTTMGIGIGYPITVDIGNGLSNDKGGLWVDWNQDLDFDDADETITTAWSGAGPYTAVITPPTGAALGETRMRVRLQNGGTPIPCGNTDLGEVEDYTINVAESVTISGYVKTGTGVGLEGVEMSPGTGEPATTDTNGYYELTFLSGWIGSITPSKTDWFFNPPARSYFNLSSDMSNQNYTATYGSLISILAIEDTYANSSDPCANYGNSNNLSSGYDGSAVYRTFLKFDLSSIPPGNVVTSATLRLHNNFISFPAPELDVHRISDRWDESTVTWNDQPSNVYTPGLIVINRSLVSGDETTWDVTEDVDGEYVDDGFYSVRIVSPDEGLTQSAGFTSKDLGVPSMAPTLEIEYMPIFGGGSGEPDDPYQIWTGEQFNTIGLYPNRWSKHFKLMDNISMAGYSGGSYNLIGTSTSPNHTHGGEFRGVFDGDFHTISDFSNSKGVFGYVYDGTIKCLKLDSPNISSSSNDSVGGMAGSVDSTNIMDCSVIGGTVSGDNYVGGFAGYCKGSNISDCSSSASVSGDDYVGGFIGRCGSFGGGGVISNCYATGSVGGLNCVGGFMGDSSDTTVINCYSTGLVAGTTNVGAFFGYNNNQFTLEDTAFDCFWDSDINPTLPAIGNIADPCSINITDPCRIIGESTANMQTQTTFTNAGWDFVGETDNGGSDDWAMPPATGYPVLWHELPVAPPLPAFAGGAGTSGNPYLIETEAQLNSIGHNSRLMDKHFKLMNDLDMDGLKYYMIAPEPYVLSGTFDGNGHTISNILLEPLFSISSFGFIGCLMDTGASIQDLTLVDPNINSDWGWGVGSLVGKNEGGTITNCHAVNANIRGLMSVGGLVGANYSYGVMSGCSATGNVSENTFMSVLFSSVGGLVGENTFWSEIENSFAKCNVSGDDCVGGLVGYNVIYSPVTNCYAGGSVTGTTDDIGGLVGKVGGSSGIEYCYSSSVVTGPNESESVGGLVGGKIGSSSVSVSDYFTACFWDSQINPGLAGIGNATDPCGVIGESTANMQTETTFTDAGWDFVGETANGTEDIWAVLEGIDYPQFVWEGPLAVSLDIDRAWMYQNVRTSTNSKLAATVSILDDPLENTSYTYQWEFILPDDVSIAPTITAGGTLSDPCCIFAAPGCDQPAGLSDSGQALTVKVTVTGDDYGNSAQDEAQFGIALLGDVNNDKVVNVADRAIINAFWRLGAAGPYTSTDCNINCDTTVNVADRAIANAVWRGVLGSNSVTSPCPLR